MKEPRSFQNLPFTTEQRPTPNSNRIRVEITWEEPGAKRVKIRYDYFKAFTQARRRASCMRNNAVDMDAVRSLRWMIEPE
jgi:hypothetical protein